MHWIGIIIGLLKVLTVLVCLLLIFVVLLQRPKNEGLGAAFGGDTASNLFGAQTTNVLANLTRWLGGIFLGLAFIIAWLGTVDPENRGKMKSYIDQRAAEQLEKEKQEEARKAAEEAAAKAAKPAATTDPVAVPPAPGISAETPKPVDNKPEEAPKPEAPKPADSPAANPAPAAPEAPKPETPKPVEPAPAAPAEPAPKPQQ